VDIGGVKPPIRDPRDLRACHPQLKHEQFGVDLEAMTGEAS